MAKIREKPLLESMTCDQAISVLYGNIGTNLTMGSIFYSLLNGYYLGSWGDYGSCLSDATYGQYIMVTIDGDYSPKNPIFTRGAFGKYSNFSSRIGLCMPQQCNMEDMRKMDQYYLWMAGNASWENVTVSYRFSSREDAAKAALPMSAGMSIVLAFIIIMMVLGIAGTCIELN
jgi:hypothetical protein